MLWLSDLVSSPLFWQQATWLRGYGPMAFWVKQNWHLKHQWAERSGLSFPPSRIGLEIARLVHSKKKRPATYILIYVIPYISISNRISVHFPSIFIESFLRAKWPDPPPTVAPKPGQAASVVKYGNFIAFNQPICGIFIGIS